MVLYKFGKVIFYFYFKIFNRMSIHGKENIPNNQGVLLCSNHISVLDPPFVGVCSPRRIRFMAKAELFKIPILKTLIDILGAFPVRRGMSDRQALRNGLKILKENEVLGIFPEGTRSKDGKLGKGLAGVGFFALRSNAAVIPTAVIGSYTPFKKIHIYFGPAINFENAKEEKVSPEVASEIIMNAIQDLLDKHKK